jgi:signal peptidase I
VRRLRALGGAGLLAAVAGAVVARSRWTSATVVGRSMEPTLHDGQRVLVRRRKPSRGDVVVFAMPPPAAAPAHRVKRVCAVAGDPVPEWLRGAVPYDVLPAGTVAVTGDNPRSEDSRHLGLIPLDRVLGVVNAPPR